MPFPNIYGQYSYVKSSVDHTSYKYLPTEYGQTEVSEMRSRVGVQGEEEVLYELPWLQDLG